MDLHLDLETASRSDLRRVGAYRYAQDPSTRIIAFALQGRSATGGIIHAAHIGQPSWAQSLQILREKLLQPDSVLHAWNAAFEYEILLAAGIIPVGFPWSRVSCTMQRALAAGYPGGLKECAEVLVPHLPKLDSKIAQRMGRPRSLNPITWWHETDDQKLLDLSVYNIRDTETEHAIAELLPPLSPAERLISAIDHQMNREGLPLDDRLIGRLRRGYNQLTHEANAESSRLTQGLVDSPGTQTGRLLEYLNTRIPGMPETVTDLRKETVDRLLAQVMLPSSARRLLELRVEAASASARKLDRMLDAGVPGSDGVTRAHGCFQYYGAGRTGRWAGRLIQPQNFPLPKLKQPPCDAIRNDHLDVEGIRLLYDKSPRDVLTSCLRGCVAAPPGEVIVSLDFAQIEARILALIAGHKILLQRFAKGEDVYTLDAQELGLPNRQFGKVTRLALGYQMGPERFQATASTYGLMLGLVECMEIVTRWRTVNQPIVRLWYAAEAAVRTVLQGLRPGSIQYSMPLGDPDCLCLATASHDRDGTILLRIRLPSGRFLYYRNARIDPDQGICFDGVGQTDKHWQTLLLYGGKIVENVVQAIARDVLASLKLRLSRPPLWRFDRTLVGTVHDELVFTAGEDDTDFLPMLEREASRPPPWLQGAPLKGEGRVARRYGK